MSAKVDNRLRYYKLLRVGKEQLGWDDEFYYAIWLPRQGATLKNGKYSASTLSISQLSQAVEKMKESGFKPQSKRKFTHGNKDWRAPRIAKINALWCALADAGVVKDKSQAACEGWCKKYTKKDRLQWARSADLNQCIEPLKKWAGRVGVELEV